MNFGAVGLATKKGIQLVKPHFRNTQGLPMETFWVPVLTDGNHQTSWLNGWE